MPTRGEATPSAPATEPSTTLRRILLVHANDHHRAALADQLRTHHRVATAPRLQGAMRLASQERFDLVLAHHDAGVDGADGLVVLTMLRILHPEMRRVLLSKVPLAELQVARVEGLVDAVCTEWRPLSRLLVELSRPHERCGEGA